MKILNKKEFLPFLKTIMDTLEKNEIKYDVPYCHIDKEEFNHITILISSDYTTIDLVKMFNFQQIKEKDSIIYTIYENFPINFVRTKDSDWGYTFIYYCWNVLPYLIDVMLKPYNLRYTRAGLKYEFYDSTFLISKNLQDIMEFLDLTFSLLVMGFPTDFTIYSFVENCPLLDWKDLSLDKYKSIDPMYDYNKVYYEKFLEHCPQIKGETLSLEEQITMIDDYFPESKLLEKLSTVEIKNNLPDGTKYIEQAKKIEAFNIDKLIEEKRKDVDKLKNKQKINLNKLKPKHKDNKKEEDMTETEKGYNIDL